MDGEDVDILGCSDNSNESTKVQSTYLTSIHQRWSLEEHDFFLIGFQQFGRKWSKLAKLIGTRTPSQVKNYGLKYLKELESKDDILSKQNLPKLEMKSANSKCFKINESEVLRIENKDEFSLENVEIEDEEIKVTHEENSEKKILNETLSEEDEECVLEEKFMLNLASMDTSNLLFPINSVREDEKIFHMEFFQGKPKKTPERYLKIRNHIIKQWDHYKPNYMTKTASRIGLTHCGDVNALGRIHTFLEQAGVINIDCKTTEHQMRGRKAKPLKDNEPDLNVSLKLLYTKEQMSLRKRKAPEMAIEELDLYNKGVTIEHGQDGAIINKVIITEPPKVNKHKINSPFRLVPCKTFSPEYPAQFELIVNLDSIQLVHVHAFCFQMEVIGLLGGHFNSETKKLYVTSAAPCDSLSTGVECEMDPVSQIVAKELLEARGDKVVGWYHSHPIFEPNPSCRDLETQSNFQELFHCQGQQPFIALIISPFLAEDLTAKLCYWVLRDSSTKPEIPYSLIPLLNSTINFEMITEQIAELADKVKLHPDRTILNQFCFNQSYTYFDKLFESLLICAEESDAKENGQKIIQEIKKIFNY